MKRRMKAKKTVAVGLSIAMLSSSTVTWAESVQTSEFAQETQETAVEKLTLQVDGENQEEVTEALEVSAQVETLVAETEAAQYPEEVSIYPQENLTTAAEVLPEAVLESTVESILPEETFSEDIVSTASESCNVQEVESSALESTAQEYESATSIIESVESTEIQTSIEDLESSTEEEASEQETESEAETELEFESESETQELESFEEPETDGYLEDALVEENFKYQVSNNQATILGYLGSDTAITIPATIGGYPVTTIGYQAFYQNQTITEVTLPEGITTIRSRAFAESALTSIVIPGSITSVEGSAFSGSQLVSATFTDGDEYTKATLGDYIFSGCEKLETVELSENIVKIGYRLIYNTRVASITIPKSVKESDYTRPYNEYEGTLAGCQYLKEIIFEDGIEAIPAYIAAGATKVERVVIPQGVKAIGDCAFCNSEMLSQVVLPEGLQTIGNSAFSNSGLTSIVIPGSITSVGSYAFSKSQLVSAVFTDGDENTKTTLGNGIFENCEKLETVELSENIVRIGYHLIYNTRVASITIPKSVKECDYTRPYNEYEGTLAGCQYLKEIIFEDGIEAIPAYIAAGATKVERVVIPQGVKAIGHYAFSNSGLTSIAIPGSITSVGNYAFYKTQLTRAEFVDGDEYTKATLGTGVFEGCEKLQMVALSENIVSVGYNIIKGTRVASITVPKNVKSSGFNYYYNTYRYYEGALGGCDYLKEIIFEDGIEAIPDYIAAGATKVERVVIPQGVKSIGHYAFSNSGLTSITIPGSITSVGNYAFYKTQLTRAEFVDGDEYTKATLGTGVFEGCEKLQMVALSENIVSVGYNIIKGTRVASITVPKNVKSSGFNYYYNTYRYYEGALGGCNYLKEIIFEEGIETIPAYLAAGATNLEKAVIPASVTKIENYAFDNCSKLVIYGIAGSYAETYAELNQIPFKSIGEFYPGIYKNSDYVVKIINSDTKKPIIGAIVTIDGNVVGMSNADGRIEINCYGTANQRIKITKSGYKAVYYAGMPWSSSTENIVEMSVADTIESDVKNMFQDVKLNESTLYGPQLSIMGYDFNLFEMKISVDLPLLKDVIMKYDAQTQTMKVLIGFDDSYKAKLEGADENDTYWSESYQEVKSLVKACGGNVDTTKLWNQFSKLRGKLKSVSGTAAFGVSGKVTGFVEMKYDNGGWEMIDSGIVANLTASASMRMPLCAIFYGELGIVGSADGKLNLTLNNQKTYDMSGSIGLTVTPSVAVGANAGLIDVQGGLSGTLNGTLSFPAKTMEEAFKATLSGKLFLKASNKFPFFEKTANYDLGSVELYPNFGAYVEPIEWKLAIEDRVVPGEGQAYEYADTQTVTLSDGRSVMVYITDDGTKSTGNHTTLMYSIYSNGAWSDAQPVCETGRADASPILKSDGNKAYVVWMNIGKVINANATESEVYQNTDLWFSELTGDTFSTPERVPKSGNKKFEYSYDLCAANGTVAVVWVENSSNDPYMQSGSNSIYSRIRQNGSWQSIIRLTTTFDAVGTLQAAFNGSNVTVQYSDGSNLFSVSGNISTEIGTGNSLKTFDGVTYYLRDSQLYSKEDVSETALGIFCAGNYQVYAGNVYWTQQNGYKSELYMQKIGTENAVQLTYDDGYINDFSVCSLENGTVTINYTWLEVNEDSDTESPYGAAYMRTVNGTKAYDLICKGIYYDLNEIKPGNKVTFTVGIQNNSSETVKNVRLRVKGKNQTVIYNAIAATSIAAGAEKEVTFTYTLPTSLSGLQLNAEVYSNEVEELNYDNNVFSCTFAETDLVISEAGATSALIKNQGYTAASAVKVEVRLDNAFGEVIAQTNAGTIASGASKTVEYTIPEEYLKFKNASDEKNFYVSVTSDTPESLMGDNYITVHVEPGHADGITLDEETVSIPCGEQRTLTAVVTGKDAIDRSVSWCSSNTDIVTVDENGTITGVATGEADVSAISVDGGYTAICHVTVTEPLVLTKLTLSKTTLQLKSGETAILTYTCEPQISEEEMKLAKWESNNEEVATVKDGTVTAVGEGNTEITVALGGLTVSCQVKVTNPVETKFSITEITAPAYNKLKISWSSYEEADGYAIYLMNDDGSYSILKYITDKTILSYVNTVTCGVTYTYKVSPYRLDGKKKVFLTESEPMSAKALPAAPTLQSVNMAAYNKIRITWSKVNGCAGYVIYRSEAEDGKYSVLKTVTQASATNYVNVVRESATYYYKIRAFVTVNGKKVYGDYSDILSGNVITGPPQNFTIKQAANGKITFTWDKVEDADGYVIYLYYPDTNKYKAIKNVTDIDVLTYGKKMTKGATYHFAMRAYRLVNGVKVYSDYGEIVSTK